MREIKFRAWDKKNKRFIANGDSMDLYYSARCNAFMFDNDNYDLNSEIVFMQYTGLTDKNGLTEIYEGDLIKVSGFDEPLEVFFKDGYFGWGEQHNGMYSFDPFGAEEIEVIGNIYEGRG